MPEPSRFVGRTLGPTTGSLHSGLQALRFQGLEANPSYPECLAQTGCGKTQSAVIL